MGFLAIGINSLNTLMAVCEYGSLIKLYDMARKTVIHQFVCGHDVNAYITSVSFNHDNTMIMG